MTDIELTKLCAEAMGFGFDKLPQDEHVYCYDVGTISSTRVFLYDPLHDDAQAMALVKRFKLVVCPVYEEDRFATWKVFKAWPEPETPDHWGDDLNRAIVECVAKMQSAVGTLPPSTSPSQ